jgi:hypothetical protein
MNQFSNVTGGVIAATSKGYGPVKWQARLEAVRGSPLSKK